jgi:hypothetical protein
MTDEKHEITHNVRYEVHTSVNNNQVPGKPAATSLMVENPLKFKAEAGFCRNFENLIPNHMASNTGRL